MRSSLDLAVELLGYDTLARKKQITTYTVANDSLNKNITYLAILILIISLLLTYFLFLRIKNKENTSASKNQKILPLFILIFWYSFLIVMFLALFTNDTIPWFGQSSQSDQDTATAKDSTKTPKKKTNLASIYQKVSTEKRKSLSAVNKIKNLPRTAQRLMTRKLLYGSNKSTANEEEDNNSALTTADSLDIKARLLCVKSNDSSCINMPFKTLLIIISLGVLVGIILGFLIIKNLLNKVDVP